jgi:hypothetical protein
MFLLVLGRIDTAAGGATCSHCLITIFPGEESVFFLAVMNTFDYLWSNQGTFGDNAFQGNRMIEVGRIEGTWITGKLAKASHKCTVIYLEQGEQQ